MREPVSSPRPCASLALGLHARGERADDRGGGRFMGGEYGVFLSGQTAASFLAINNQSLKQLSCNLRRRVKSASMVATRLRQYESIAAITFIDDLKMLAFLSNCESHGLQ